MVRRLCAAERSGRAPAIADALVAATSLVHGLTLATCSVLVYACFDVPLVDPLEPA